MPVAHIYADGVLQDAMPLGAKVYGKFPKRLGQISAASGGESGGESDGRSDGRSGGESGGKSGGESGGESGGKSDGESDGNADADVVPGPEPLGL